MFHLVGIALSVVGVILLAQPWYDKNTLEAEETNVPTITRYMHYHNFHMGGQEEIIFTPLRVTEQVQAYETNDTTVVINSTILPSSFPGTDDFDDSSSNKVLGYILAVAAGIGMTLGQIIHKSKLQECNSFILNFYAGMVGTVVPIILSLVLEEMVFPSGMLKMI